VAGPGVGWALWAGPGEVAGRAWRGEGGVWGESDTPCDLGWRGGAPGRRV